jgi:hypothetical protein
MDEIKTNIIYSISEYKQISLAHYDFYLKQLKLFNNDQQELALEQKF